MEAPIKTAPLPTSQINQSPNKSQWPIIGLVVLVVIVLATYYLKQNQKNPPKIPTTVPIKQTKPTNKAITVPSTYNSFSGVITTIKDNGITVKINSQTQTFSIASNSAIQKLASSSGAARLDKPNLLNLSALKPGQTVSLQIDKKTNQVVSILII